ncbi:hypothetical protein LAZ67_X001940 [Cordylochernes scorpioides]|uniref:Uncharacterized protein n=1 Tax=Cordylochernes scorpioides TaxID=51811 RepID=A0ABY6LT78_9ARAC|nr:hypothetical protein LAZ67_X001940 [Cordylochernes scorpioides]
MSGHVMVGLASIEKAEHLVEKGLTISNTFHRAFPYRRKVEKIILGNLPITVREEDIIEALRPYYRVVSLAYKVVSCNGYTWTTGNREAFDLLNEGRKLRQLPAKLVIISKGESTLAYITYGALSDRGLEGYGPILLPSANYRVLASILLRRFKPHLPALVPECQTYAVLERSPSWNIAQITDAVEEATAGGSPLAVVCVDLESTWIAAS